MLSPSWGFASKPETLSVEASKLPRLVRNLLEPRLANGATVQIAQLQDLVRMPTRPAGDLNLSGIDPALVRTRLDDLASGAMASRQDEVPAIRARVEVALHAMGAGGRSARDAGLVKIDDLVEPVPDDPTESQVRRLAESFESLREMVSIRAQPNDATRFDITSHRRAFLVETDAADGIPGRGTLGGKFGSEQEVTGVKNLTPARIKRVFLQPELVKEFPAVR